MRLIQLFSAAALASSACAAPRSHSTIADRFQGDERFANRFNGWLSDHNLLPSHKPSNFANATYLAERQVGGPQASSNWAGAEIQTLPTDGAWHAGGAVMVVPGPPAGDMTTSIASMWVGLDDTSKVIQTGFVMAENADGSLIYSAWYEWYPADPIFLPDATFKVEQGMSLMIRVQIADTDASMARAEYAQIDPATGSFLQYYSQDFSAPNPDTIASGLTVEWIMERVGGSTGASTLFNFQTASFTNVYAEDSHGTQITAQGATIINLARSDTDNTGLARATIGDAGLSVDIEWFAGS